MKKVVVTGSFDDLRSHDVRFLEEASKLGSVHVWMWSDEAMRQSWGKEPKFTQEERLYVLQAIRYVDQVRPVTGQVDPNAIPGARLDLWAVDQASDNAQKRAFCEAVGLEYHVLRDEDLRGFPEMEVEASQHSVQARKKVLVTGCYDWLHSGHVRFFEETAALGDLCVVVGHDDNVRLLKGEGHPLFPQDERRYMVQSIRHVKRALISTGHGWMDAEPEIATIKPDIYLVNEDGDKPEKRAFCAQHGLEYVVLKRLPKEGLPRRQSTDLRGF